MTNNTNTNAGRFTISTDWECNAEDFWSELASHGGGSFSEPINELLANDSITVTAEQRDQLISHFRTITGWETGIAHAPHPVRVESAKVTAETITTEQISALRAEAADAGDDAQVDICDRALNLRANGAEAAGETWAAEACADAINAGQG